MVDLQDPELPPPQTQYQGLLILECERLGQEFPENSRGRKSRRRSQWQEREAEALLQQPSEAGNKTPEARPLEVSGAAFGSCPKSFPRGTSGKPLHHWAPGSQSVQKPAEVRPSAAPRRVGDPQGASGGAAACFPVPQLLPRGNVGRSCQIFKISAEAKNMDFKM